MEDATDSDEPTGDKDGPEEARRKNGARGASDIGGETGRADREGVGKRTSSIKYYEAGKRRLKLSKN